MQWAAVLAGDLGANLRLVHVIPEVDHFHLHGIDNRLEKDFCDGARQMIRQLQEKQASTCRCASSRAMVAACVQEEARRHGADLIVIGRAPARNTRSLAGAFLRDYSAVAVPGSERVVSRIYFFRLRT